VKINGIFANYLWSTVLGKRLLNILNHVIFSSENTNIDVSVFMFDLRMINMSSECEYDWYGNISACSTEYEDCDSLTRQQTSYSGSAGWYFRYHSIHIQITYTSLVMLWVRISIRARCTTLCDKVWRWLATGRWFSPVFSTNNAHHQILSKVALNTIKQIKKRLWYDNSPSWCHMTYFSMSFIITKYLRFSNDNIMSLFFLIFPRVAHNISLLVWWWLTPRSIIFQLYRGGQFYWWRTPEDTEKTIDLWHVRQTLSHNVVHLALMEIRTNNISGDRHGLCR
jgi:hypothetical protein